MADSEKRAECFEAASRLERELAAPLVALGAALAAGVFAGAVRVGGAFKRSAGSARRLGDHGAHRSVTRST